MILDEILRRTEQRVAQLPDSFPQAPQRGHAGLAAAIRSANGKNAVIAEIKCASPGMGIIRHNVDIAGMARALVAGGCIALSILTEPFFFAGNVQDIARAKAAVGVPVLRKDFIIDERQIAETVHLGADAVLLIVAVLGDRLPEFVDYAYAAGLEPLVEVHNPSEIETALLTRAAIIGVNNRDLLTLTVDRSTTRLLSDRIRSAGRLVVSESGVRSVDDVRELKPYCDAFLIGSAIMAADDPKRCLEEFVCV